MKFYRNTVLAVIQILNEVFNEKRYADKVIEHVLKQNPKWGGRDRRFIAESAYEIIRWYRLIQECAGVTTLNEENGYRIFGTWCVLNEISPPDWDEFSRINPDKILKTYEKARQIFKVRESIPDWLDELGRKEVPVRWEEEIHAMNAKAEVVLRTNTLKITRTELHKKLREHNVESEIVSWCPDALVLTRRQNVFRLPLFKEGLFEMQDASSQNVGLFLQVQPGMRVIDACAGSGGKTLHLSALLENKGKVIAMDLEQWKLDELKKRARRGGATNIEPKLIDSNKTIKRLSSSADRLLLDVPCSGLGVLKRNPDAKWKLTPAFIETVKQSQADILNNYSTMLKPGGLMVYSTCSLLECENEGQVGQFLQKNAGAYRLLKEKRHWPSEGFDGFYMALIEKIAQ